MSLAAGSRANAASYAWLLRLRHDRAAEYKSSCGSKNRLQPRQLVGRKTGEHGVAAVEPAVYECTDQNVYVQCGLLANV